MQSNEISLEWNCSIGHFNVNIEKIDEANFYVSVLPFNSYIFNELNLINWIPLFNIKKTQEAIRMYRRNSGDDDYSIIDMVI